MIDQSIVYAPCPCGSGKKFKFCCFKKYRSQLSEDMSQADVTQLVRCEIFGIHSDQPSYRPEAEELHEKGYDLMKAREFAEARESFKRSREIDPRHSASWNNEASCAWEMGDYEAAYEIQREGNANMLEVDSFGLARLAVYAHTTGREEEAVRALESSVSVPPISVFGALEVCFALALYHRHRDILDYVAKSGMADSERLAFYTGIAHANLDEMGLAELDLRKTGDSQHTFMPDRYLDAIKDDMLPWTTEGEDAWPYFDRYNFQPARPFEDDVIDGVDPFVRCPKPFVEDCIAFLLADGSLDTHGALTLARKWTSDRAKRMVESLERMVKSEEECQAREESERNADVDAQGRPRVPFELAYFSADLPDSEYSEQEDKMIRLSVELGDSDIPTTSDSYVKMENLMCGLARAHADSVKANLAYFALVEKHDAELAHGLTESFCRQHLDDLHCSGTLLMLHAKIGEFAKAADVLDHFSIPICQIDLTKCQEWGAALLMLSLSDDFCKEQPVAYARVKEFLEKFTEEVK